MTHPPCIWPHHPQRLIILPHVRIWYHEYVDMIRIQYHEPNLFYSNIPLFAPSSILFIIDQKT